VIRAGKRAQELVGQILTFSRGIEQEIHPVQIHLIVKEVLKLVRSAIPSTISIKQDIDQESGMVMADSTEIHQLVMNLCTNAFQAMPDGGSLTVSLGCVKVNAESGLEFQVTPGTYVKLQIQDTGCGMTKEVRERIFEPYFTTKKIGEGTGLGLSMVHGIVQSMQGQILVDSEPGQGTTFSVYLPEAKVEGGKADHSVFVPISGGDEHILVVDDEKTIVLMLEEALKTLGYQVTVRTDSEETLQLFKQNPDSFDLLITDMSMPKLTGADLAREILAIRPGLPIILCSGFRFKVDEQKAKALGIREYIIKPIVKKDIAQIIRKVLDQEHQ
jgi:CheY-like chemotaxis protein